MDERALKSPHDWLFKSTFSEPEHAASVFKRVLPKRLVELIDWSTLELETVESSSAELGRCDLRYRVAISGIESKLIVLFEHQSSSDNHMGFRLLRYIVAIWSDAYRAEPTRKLPPIIPVVLHHSESGWTGPIDILEELDLTPEIKELLAPHLPRFRFLLDDLSHRSDEQFRKQEHTSLALATLLAFTRLRGASEVASFKGLLEEALREVARSPNGQEALNQVLRYAVQASEIDLKELKPYVAKTFSRTAAEDVMTTAERLRQEGLQEGLQKGLQEGRIELTRKLLALKFGPLPSNVIQRLESASEEELDRIAERVLSASCLDEVLG